MEPVTHKRGDEKTGQGGNGDQKGAIQINFPKLKTVRERTLWVKKKTEVTFGNHE